MELTNKWIQEIFKGHAARFYFFHKKDSEWAFHYVGTIDTIDRFLSLVRRPDCFGSYMVSRKHWVMEYRPRLIRGKYIVVNGDIAAACDLWIEKASPVYVKPSNYEW